MRQRSVKNQFDLHTRLFNNVLEGITDDLASRRAGDSVNHIIWIAGHLTNARNGMHAIGGYEANAFYPEFFDRGSTLDPTADYPPLDEIREKWNTVSSRVSKGLGGISEDMLASEAPIKTPMYGLDGTMHGFLDFLMHHEAYHIGQIGILRKYVGRQAMRYD